MSDLSRHWHLELYAWWSFYNDEYAAERLRRPAIRIDASTSHHGSWNAARREITISQAHILAHPWHEVMATLRHEMAHQYADEILGAVNETPHGPLFRQASNLLRVTPKKSDTPDASDARTRALDKVTKLLALSASPNESEAAAAMRKAHELLAKHNIRMVEADAERRFTFRTLGTVKKRHQAWEYTLASLLNEFFFVETIWARGFDAKNATRGTNLEVYGTVENLDMAEYVWRFLVGLLPNLWTDYRTSNGLRSNAERMRFFDGVLRGFADKLGEERRRLREERALVWTGDPALESWFRHHNPRVHMVATGGGRASAAYHDGMAAGRDVTIHRPVARQGASQKLLPGS